MAATPMPQAIEALMAEKSISKETHLPMVVCGAHLAGLPLHWQLADNGAVFLEKTESAPVYRMVAFENGPIKKPGMIRATEGDGVAFEVEVYALPMEKVGKFMTYINDPLAIGRVEMKSGDFLHGFVCGADKYWVEKEKARDISKYKGWKAFMKAEGPSSL